MRAHITLLVAFLIGMAITPTASLAACPVTSEDVLSTVDYLHNNMVYENNTALLSHVDDARIKILLSVDEVDDVSVDDRLVFIGKLNSTLNSEMMAQEEEAAWTSHAIYPYDPISFRTSWQTSRSGTSHIAGKLGVYLSRDCLLMAQYRVPESLALHTRWNRVSEALEELRQNAAQFHQPIAFREAQGALSGAREVVMAIGLPVLLSIIIFYLLQRYVSFAPSGLVIRCLLLPVPFISIAALYLIMQKVDLASLSTMPVIILLLMSAFSSVTVLIRSDVILLSGLSLLLPCGIGLMFLSVPGSTSIPPAAMHSGSLVSAIGIITIGAWMFRSRPRKALTHEEEGEDSDHDNQLELY